MEQQTPFNDQNSDEYSSMHITEINIAQNNLLQKVPSTAEILVYKYQNCNINIQWKNWAVDMLQAGYDNENLAILAGEDIHCNPFEFAELTNKIFEELRLNEIDENHIFLFYSIYLINQVILSPSKNKVSNTLMKLERLCMDNNYNSVLQPFYDLSIAISELEDCEMQWCWNDSLLTKENWYEYVLEYFKQWIDKPVSQHKIVAENNEISSTVFISNSKSKNIFKRLISFFQNR